MDRARIRCGALAVLVVGCGVAAARASGPPAGWKTYRSEQFGFEFSYPPEMELKVFSGGRSGQFEDAATGSRLVDLEIWPGDLCPRQPPGTTPRVIGTGRAAAVTQADGPDGSSVCGEPVSVRESVSGRGVRLYELDLTCVREHHDDQGRGELATPVREAVGRKGPTFFADVSQSWRTRVLMVDPVGTDPRQGPAGHRAEPATVRRILATLATFPLPEPDGICIEDLR